MPQHHSTLPRWVFIVSGLFAVLELGVSIALCVSPRSVVDIVDLDAAGVDYLVYMWAARQFALGVIFAFATWKRSAPMLTICYIFLLVMFFGDILIGIYLKENSMVLAGVVMCAISGALLRTINKTR